ncbi:MAG TPA: acyl-CoA dehydrogenase family protein, partial [candidate division Zixibacteria bacterium]|nr:acyl-CoA dehydrogenase family protein [candidate division Zixibacteria bacterium]
MDFELNDQQLLMRDSAREFAQKRLLPFAREWDEAEEMPKTVLSEMAELGYFGMLLPETFGGLGLDPLSYILALEEISKANASVEITLSVHNSLACQAIIKYGTEEQRKKYLPRMAQGELIGAYSLSEPDAGTDAGGLKATAVKKGGSYT